MKEIDLLNQNTISLYISIIALIASTFIGILQVRISKRQSDMQDKVELYLSCEPLTKKSISGKFPDTVLFAIYVRNIGTNVVYIEKYIFNGKEYPLEKDVLPPVSSYPGCYFIELPNDGQTHVSLTIDFFDWKMRKWQTNGYANSVNGKWEITYSPCKRVRK